MIMVATPARAGRTATPPRKEAERELSRDVLSRAKGILAEKGWTQGASTDAHGRVCVGRALQLAYLSVTGYDPGPNLIAIFFGDHGGDIPTWNDDPARTLEQVYAHIDERLLALST